MDPRVFLLICLAAASRHQPSSVLEVDPNDPQDHAFNEADFQVLRDIVNGDESYWKPDAAGANMWPSFLKAHPEEGWHLFKKIAKDEHDWVRKAAAVSPAWPMLLETHTAEALQLFQELVRGCTHVREGVTLSPAWPMLLQTHTAEAWQLFQELAQAEASVREKAAESPAWPMLLETHHAEAWQLFQKLATEDDDDYWQVRRGAAISPAWPMLLQTHHAEAWQLFQKLAQDKETFVKEKAAISPAWPDLVKSYQWESWQVLVELMSNRALLHHGSLAELAESPAWKAFGNVPLTGVAEHLKSFTPTNLQEMAMSAQKVADNGFRHKVKDLPVVTGVATTLQRSSNETWLGEMAELPLFAGSAAQRVSPAQDL